MIPLLHRDSISLKFAEEINKIVDENIPGIVNDEDQRYYSSLLNSCVGSIENAESPTDMMKISIDDFSILVKAFMKQNIAIDQPVFRNYHNNSITYKNYYRCPVCSSDVGGRYSHCKKCGQLINWI